MKFLICLLLLTLNVFADEMKMPDADKGMNAKHPCASAVKEMCKGIQKGEGRIMACLAEHADHLNPECKAKIETMKSEHPCFMDHKLCPGMKWGAGLGKCLKENPNTSAACKAKMEAGMAKRKAAKGEVNAPASPTTAPAEAAPAAH
jgi:hypothetical protein